MVCSYFVAALHSCNEVRLKTSIASAITIKFGTQTLFLNLFHVFFSSFFPLSFPFTFFPLFFIFFFYPPFKKNLTLHLYFPSLFYSISNCGYVPNGGHCYGNLKVWIVTRKMDSIWRMSKHYFMPLKLGIYFMSNIFVLKTKHDRCCKLILQDHSV